jgi:signal transduction histidine kinase
LRYCTEQLQGFGVLGGKPVETISEPIMLSELIRRFALVLGDRSCMAEVKPIGRIKLETYDNDLKYPVHVYLEPAADFSWTIDSYKVIAVLRQLVSNGVTAMGQKSRTPIVVRLGRRRRCVRASVRDTGIGIPEADQAAVFDLDFTSKARGQGGLGLPVVKAYTEGMGGKVTLRSKPGKGTTVTFVLPVLPPLNQGDVNAYSLL